MRTYSRRWSGKLRRRRRTFVCKFSRRSCSPAAAEDLENPKTAWQGLWRRNSHELNIHCYLIGTNSSAASVADAKSLRGKRLEDVPPAFCVRACRSLGGVLRSRSQITIGIALNHSSPLPFPAQFACTLFVLDMQVMAQKDI